MTEYSELKRLAEHHLSLGRAYTVATPTAVLALIAENERLQESHEQICTNYNQVSYASEKRGKQIDQLKAELEHTGYDHDLLRTERDQLKAENEALRNGLRLARHWCTSALKAARVDSQPSELLDIACLLRHQASDIDAALGQGEQS